VSTRGRGNSTRASRIRACRTWAALVHLSSRARANGCSTAALALLASASLLSACGGIIAPDLFVVQRSGSTPGARLTLLVNEEGIAHCNGGPPHRLSDPQLIQARTIQEGLHAYATQHESLPPAPGSVLSYNVRDADGSVRFSDNSPRQPHVMRELALLVLTVARDVCRLPQAGA
jgi:hypothetical protein